MNRLHAELDRLYLCRPAGEAAPVPRSHDLFDASGATRALVLALRSPADWQVLGRAWQAVQAELGLPAPAIAVSGTDALQLWFSLQEAVPAVEAHAFLEGLRRRFLADIDPERLGMWPRGDASAPSAVQHAQPVPMQQAQSGNWSAFVAPDLAPVFAETPWLDIPPGEEGQAALLRGLCSIDPASFATARQALAETTAAGAMESDGGQPTRSMPTRPFDDPRAFLLQVMNDGSVSMALRIEAAKVLLQHPSR